MQFQIECVESKTLKNQSQYGKFVLEPLERGQGTTVGNSLRRVLLSNLEGTAITAVRIAGVNHEFAAIEGVREDVMEILLNMKEVVLKSYTSAPQIGRVMITGPATVRAAQFDLPSEVEIVAPSQYIATLAEGARLEMEFRIEKGKGYRSVERGRDESAAVDFLQIDAVFMPVNKVNYSVEDARIDGSLEKDRLLLDIWTNGSLTPQEALSQAASALVDLFKPLQEMILEPSDQAYPVDDDPTSQIPIEELQLSVRAYNCLKRAQINSVADLLDYSQEDLLEIKNFGQRSAEEVIEALQRRLGITLPHETKLATPITTSNNSTSTQLPNAPVEPLIYQQPQNIEERGEQEQQLDNRGDTFYEAKNIELSELRAKSQAYLEGKNSKEAVIELIDSEIQASFTISYDQLWQYLRDGKWKKADIETGNIILQLTSRNEEEISLSSISNLPTEDVRTINKLWIDHSNGDFGFSVQKQIYFSLNKDIGNFGERVGWRGKEGWFGGALGWHSYDFLTFKREAPRGHLPGCWLRIVPGLHGGTKIDNSLKAILERNDW